MVRPLAGRLRFAVVVAGLALSVVAAPFVTTPSVAGASQSQAVVPITGTVAPLVLLRVERGNQLVVEVTGAKKSEAGGSTVVAFPKALALQVVANAPWKLTVAPAGELPVQLALSSASAPGAVQVRPDGTGGVGAYGRPGQLRLTWDVTVVVPAGTPEGVYAVPLMVELAAV